MEPFPKRQRLYAPLNRDFPQSFGNQHAYYDEPVELEDDFEDELQEEYEEEEELEEEEEEEVSDPDAELQQRRARLDYKLKSTFEAIFEKYGQDFEGVGDEIDLETGEVVVNNGHLLEMHDERDAGDTSRRNLVREYTEEPEETDDIPTSSLEETEVMDDEDGDGDEEDEEEVFSEDEEMEDDMILRGFARANRFVQASPELGPSRVVIPPRREPQPPAISRPAIRGNALPSRTDILAQFGPQLGPQIVDFVSQQQVPSDSHIEPAWRAPELPSFAPVKRPTVKRATLAPEIERSPSPEASKSVWAPVRTRGPNKPKHNNANVMFRGQSMIPVHRQNLPLNPFRRQSMDDLSLPYGTAFPRARRVRTNFTAEDDQIILDWVARAKARGQALLSEVIWRELEAKHPNHSAGSWKSRYQRCFTYLPDQANEYGSDSETSVEIQPALPLPRARKGRTRFTTEDDKILLDWVDRIRERGLPLWSVNQWQELADKHPRHSIKSWQGRYQNYFRHLWSNQAEESESIISDTSIGTHVLEEREAAKARAAAVSHVPVRPPASERPSRIRKPAQRDSRIISWSEAVDTIQSLDPALHAEMLEDNKRMKAGNWSFDYPGPSSNLGKSFSENRARVHESANGYRPKGLGTAVKDFVEPESHPESLDVEASPSPEAIKVRAPCPHADCRPYGTIMYRLQRLDKEDLSEMCLHLFRVHHTTPFPCGELGCKRKGEDGFFMQADLVKHVRTEHPNAGALQRLRGRVDSELLDRSSRPLKNMSSVPVNDRPVSRARDSDFMSPSKGDDRRITSSSRPFSSSSDPDRTPRGATGMPGASTSTPMTSVSSMKVNRSSGTTVIIREVSESQESLRSDEHADEGMNVSTWAGHVPIEELNGLVSANARTSAFREPLMEEPPLSRNVPGRSALPTPLASTWYSPRDENYRPPAYAENQQHLQSNASEASTVLQLPKHSSSSTTRTASGSQLPPPRNFTKPQTSLNNGRTSSLPESRKAPPKTTPTSQRFARNGLDPSYEFSDEEIGVEPIVKPLPPKPKEVSIASPQPTTQIPTTITSTTIPPATVHPITQPSVPTPAQKPSPKKPVTQPNAGTSIATPANRRKSILQHVLDDDYDELSLGADDFVFMFSRPRTDVRPSSNVQIKQEQSTDTPPIAASIPAKKRKLSMFRAGSDDELCVIGPSPPQQPLSTKSKPEIKIEEVDATLPQSQPTLPKVGAGREGGMQVEASTSQSNPQIRRKSNIQASSTSTPLLDLTPSRSKPNGGREILDSAAESSSPNQVSSPTHPRNRTRGQREAGTSSPLAGLLTPVKRKRYSGDPLKVEQVTVVVKTPGGTLRRCGEDGFECGRSFCFRCGETRTG